MHLNSDYRHPDNGPLFELTELTGELDGRIEEVKENAPQLADDLGQDEPPEQVLIRECKGCDYQNRCWALPEQSLFTLPNVPWQYEDTFLKEEQFHLDEIEKQDLLKPRHERYLAATSRDLGAIVERTESVIFTK